MQSNTPWSTELDRLLYMGVFHRDKERALAAARHWFSHVDVQKITYEHHRLMAAIGRRFSDLSEVTDNRTIIRNVSKQLWLRAAQNLRDFEQVVPELKELRVPFALGGHIVWAPHPENKFIDCETLEVVVHHNALGFVLERFCDAGWFPGPTYHFYRGHDRIGLRSARGVHMTLLSSKAACQLTKQSNTAFWDEATQANCFGVQLQLLSGLQTLKLWPLRLEDRLQIFIDHHYAGTSGTGYTKDLRSLPDWFRFWQLRKRMLRIHPEVNAS